VTNTLSVSSGPLVDNRWFLQGISVSDRRVQLAIGSYCPSVIRLQHEVCHTPYLDAGPPDYITAVTASRGINIY